MLFIMKTVCLAPCFKEAEGHFCAKKSKLSIAVDGADGGAERHCRCEEGYLFFLPFSLVKGM